MGGAWGDTGGPGAGSSGGEQRHKYAVIYFIRVSCDLAAFYGESCEIRFLLENELFVVFVYTYLFILRNVCLL